MYSFGGSKLDCVFIGGRKMGLNISTMSCDTVGQFSKDLYCLHHPPCTIQLSSPIRYMQLYGDAVALVGRSVSRVFSLDI